MSELRLDGLRHRYAGAPRDALAVTDLVVPDGSMTSVVGPSGSGKTTLLRIAAGLQAPTAGRVLLDGRDVTPLPTERRDLTVMFQQPHLFEHLDVAGNVAFGPRATGTGRREARHRAQRYLDLVHLEGLARRPVASLSGGQQQRVALARALAAERGVLLLDEPFSSLDRELRERMHDLLLEVRAALAPTVLLVTHDLDEAALADTTVVLIGGELHQHAPAETLHRAPATLATARLVGGFAEVPGRVENGLHHSRWGRVPVVTGSPVGRGEGVLLLRREDLLLDEPPVAADGAPLAASGAGLVARGRVTRVRRRAARQVATVRVDDGTVEVELPPGRTTRVGGQVEVRAPEGTRGWVVAADGTGGR